MISHIVDREGTQSGIAVWLNLQLYPATILMYSGGIGAIASGNYENLAAIFNTKVATDPRYQTNQEVVLEIAHVLSELDRMKFFSMLPTHEQHLVPRSEYLFKLLQPQLDDLLFLGRSYEDLFDRFEIMQALVHADLRLQSKSGLWGPLGRFAWKHKRRDTSIYTAVLNEAHLQQENWPILKAGLFGGSYQRFQEVAKGFEELINRLGWY